MALHHTVCPGSKTMTATRMAALQRMQPRSMSFYPAAAFSNSGLTMPFFAFERPNRLHFAGSAFCRRDHDVVFLDASPYRSVSSRYRQPRDDDHGQGERTRS
jgi:hypothetical protein